MDSETGRQFVETFSSWLVSLPHDLKMLYEAASDENLDRDARKLAVGAIIYAVGPNDFIAVDRNDFLGYCDDCLLVRMALRDIVAKGDEDSAFFRSRFSEFFDSLDGELATCRSAMPETFDWIDSKVELLTSLEYKGKKVDDYLDDDEASEFLYEEGLGFVTEYPVDEETLSDKLKKASTIIEVLAARRSDDELKSK